MMFSSVLLTDSFALNGTSLSAAFATQKLKNPYRTPILIDELRFSATAITVDPFFYLDMEMKFGPENLTDSYVPLCLLAPSFNTDPRKQFRLSSPVKPNAPRGSRAMVWRLPRPLWVSYHESITIRFRLNAPRVAAYVARYGTFPTITLHVALAGRSTPSDALPPDQVHIPWVANYVSPSIEGPSLVEYETTATDLVNPAAQPFKLQHIVGRLMFNGDNATDFNGASPPSTAKLQGMKSTLLYDCASLTLRRHRGSMIIRDLTPWGAIFEPGSSVWAARTVLPSKSYYIAKVRLDTRDLDATGFDTQMMLGLVGYRTVDRSETVKMAGGDKIPESIR
mgnify:FL=1